jgi:hypothetical protein
MLAPQHARFRVRRQPLLRLHRRSQAQTGYVVTTLLSVAEEVAAGTEEVVVPIHSAL